jgi:hypothetical protein
MLRAPMQTCPNPAAGCSAMLAAAAGQAVRHNVMQPSANLSLQ